MKGSKVIKIIIIALLCVSMGIEAQSIYILPVVSSNAPNNATPITSGDFPIHVTGCSNNPPPFMESSGAQACLLPANLSFTNSAGNMCLLNLDEQGNTMDGTTCISLNPGGANSTVLIQGGFSGNTPSPSPTPSGQTASFYLLPSLNPAQIPVSDFPITVTGCTNGVSFSQDSGAQLCQFVSPAALTVKAVTGDTCQIMVTGTANGVTVTGGTCKNLNTNPASPTPTVLLQGFTGGKGGGGNARSITIVNNTSITPLNVYLGFSGESFGGYTPSKDFPNCSFTTGNPWVCSMSVQTGTPVVLNFNKTSQVSIAFAAGNNLPWGPCPTGLAEFTLNGKIGSVTQDTIDVSLVNGINYNIAITSSNNSVSIDTSSVAPNYIGQAGIYPLGCDACALSINPPTGAKCPAKTGTCQGGSQNNPTTPCQISTASGSNAYTITFSDK